MFGGRYLNVFSNFRSGSEQVSESWTLSLGSCAGGGPRHPVTSLSA